MAKYDYGKYLASGKSCTGKFSVRIGAFSVMPLEKNDTLCPM